MCGVFGVVAPGQEAARIAALGIFALQHRGQESAGVAVSDGEQLMLYKDLGLIAQVLDDRRLPSLRGELAIAHCRYSTTGSTVWENAQPTLRLGPRRALAIGHNGNLVNTRELLAKLAGGRARLPASTDTELLTALSRTSRPRTRWMRSAASCRRRAARTAWSSSTSAASWAFGTRMDSGRSSSAGSRPRSRVPSVSGTTRTTRRAGC